MYVCVCGYITHNARGQPVVMGAHMGAHMGTKVGIVMVHHAHTHTHTHTHTYIYIYIYILNPPPPRTCPGILQLPFGTGLSLVAPHDARLYRYCRPATTQFGAPATRRWAR